eukprot:COSAG01_NODE_8716_length_2687_cov_5.427357_3_plen_61_part_01
MHSASQPPFLYVKIIAFSIVQGTACNDVCTDCHSECAVASLRCHNMSPEVVAGGAGAGHVR